MWTCHIFPMGSFLHRPQADLHICARPQSEGRGDPQSPLFATKINPKAEEPWAARSWDQITHRDHSLIKLRGGVQDMKAADAKESSRLAGILLKILWPHFSLDFPNTNNPNNNLVHIWTTFPIPSSVQGMGMSAMRGSLSPHVAHNPSEESDKTCCNKVSHRSTAEVILFRESQGGPPGGGDVCAGFWYKRKDFDTGGTF